MRPQQNSAAILREALDKRHNGAIITSMMTREALVKLRKSCKGKRGPLTQIEAAALFGCGYSTIRAWEAGYHVGSWQLPDYIAALRALRATQKGASK
jgi:hypothetical protein